jgi:hypothetical protein
MFEVISALKILGGGGYEGGILVGPKYWRDPVLSYPAA